MIGPNLKTDFFGCLSLVFVPEVNPTNALDGRVTFEDVTYSFLDGEDLKKAGIRLAEAFPGYRVWVTAGPWRMYDVKYLVDGYWRIIHLDFYSVRPGLEYLDSIIKEIRERLPRIEAEARKERPVALPEFLWVK